jgi:glycosyltransferase involved in cell wall biosynthesis
MAEPTLSDTAPLAPAVRSARILLLATQVFGVHGGVQAYMRRLTEICSDYCLPSGGRFACVSLHGDRPSGLAFDLRRASGKTGYLAAAAAAARRYRPQLVIAGHTSLAKVAWMLRQLEVAGPYTVVLHGIEAWCRLTPVDLFSNRRADSFIATTRYTAREFASHNAIDERRIRIVPLGLGDAALASPPARGRGGALNVLTIGRLSAAERYKGVDTLIEALPLVRANGFEISLTVVGDGDDAPRLKELADRTGMASHVHFKGAVPQPELERLLAGCDIFAMPSAKEGFGIVFLEAMRYGKPCIGGNHGGTPEVIEDSKDGYLVEFGDLRQLAGRLERFAAEPALIEFMGCNARNKVARSYLRPRLERRWFEVLDLLLGGEVPRC